MLYGRVAGSHVSVVWALSGKLEELCVKRKEGVNVRTVNTEQAVRMRAGNARDRYYKILLC